MKKLGRFTLFVSPTGWTVGLQTTEGAVLHEVQSTAGSSPQDAAQLTVDALDSLGHTARHAVVALPPQQCLCAAISADGLPRRGARKAMLYRLEQSLPISAEEVAADFVGRHDPILGVCTWLQALDPILESLVERKITVAAVSPVALLALAELSHIARGPEMLNGDVLLWQDGSVVHVFSLVDGAPTAWLAIPAERDDILLSLSSLILARRSALRLVSINVNDDLLDHIKRIPEISLLGGETLLLVDAAVAASNRIIDGSAEPLVDLRGGDNSAGAYRSDQLRSAFRAAIAAGLLLCACLVGSILCRASQYSDFVNRAQTEKETIFHQIFPGQPIPAGIESRLQSAEREIHGAGGHAVANVRPDALATLHEFLIRLPTDVRYSVSELDLDPDRLSIAGQVLSHQDADAIVLSLRHSPRFFVEDALTQQTKAGAIQFSIAAAIQAGNPRVSRRAP